MLHPASGVSFFWLGTPVLPAQALSLNSARAGGGRSAQVCAAVTAGVATQSEEQGSLRTEPDRVGWGLGETPEGRSPLTGQLGKGGLASTPAL